MTICLNGIDIAFVDDRRQSNDRRSRPKKAQFPLVDSDGRFVKVDRRHAPDRRLANIQVKEVAVNGRVFNTLFKK